MDRRAFLNTSATVAAATGLSATSATAGEFSGIIKKAIKYSNVAVPELAIEDKFKLVRDLGYDGIELRTSHASQKDEFAKASAKADLPIHGLVNSSNPDISTAIEFCAEVGGNGVLITCPYNKKRPLIESWTEWQTNIRKALPTAEKHEVKILVENVWASFLISAFDTVRFLDEIDNPWCACYFDVGNNVRWGVPEHWVEILGKRIGKLDIKEWDERLHRNEGLRKGFSQPLGEGTIDWANVRTALKKVNYSGWATAEVGNCDRERLKDIAERMDQILGLA